MALEDLTLPGGPGGAKEPSPQPPSAKDETDTGRKGKSGRTGQTELLKRWSDLSQTPNIAEEILEEWEDGESRLSEIGQRVVEEYKIDLDSRSEWIETNKAGMDLAMQVARKKTSPWDGASNVIYPLISVASIQFAARAYPGIVQNRNVVKGMVVGPDKGVPMVDPQTQQPVQGQDGKPQYQPGPDGVPQGPGLKRARADRIADHMSWQFLEEQDEWEEETDKLLHVLPIPGCVFKKTYFDPSLGRNVSVMVSAENLVVNYWAKSLATASRITEELKLLPVELEEQKRAGVFIDQDYPLTGANSNDRDAPREFLEQHRRWDLDDDGYPEPYIVTVQKDTGKVARIAAAYDPDGIVFSKIDNRVQTIRAVEYYTKFDFLPNPKGAFYGVGFGQLLRPLNDAINTAINQLFDAESLKISGGGFIGRGLSMNSGSVKFKLGEWKVVNSPGSDIRNAIVPLPTQGGSAVMFTLLNFLVEAGKEVASIKDVLSGETTPANTPATSMLAMIEQGLKVFTGIWKRVHRSLKSEYDKQFRLNRLYLEEQTSYRIGEEWKTVTRQDYVRGSGVVPWSDSTMVTDMQRLGRAGVLQMFANDPLLDGVEIRRRILQAADIDGISQLMQSNPMSNPMLFFKRAELGLAQIKTKAQAIYHMARGYQALAMGDKAVGDQHLAWLAQHMEMLQGELDRLDTIDDGSPLEQKPQTPDPFSQPPQPQPGGDPPGVGQVKTFGMGAGFGGS